MNNICITNLPAGIDPNCFGFEKPVKNLAFVPADSEFTNIASAKLLSSWTALISDLKLYVPQGLVSYEADGEEAKVNTTAFGKKFFVQDGIPSMKAQIETSYGDFLEMLNSFRGGVYRVFFILTDGSVKATVTDDGKVRGFKARVFAQTNGVGALDAPENNYPVNILFDNYEEFMNGIILGLKWNANIELTAAMPFGLQVYKAGAYDTGTSKLSVVIKERGTGNGYTGLTQADFAILGASNSATAISAVTDNGNGNYDLTIDANSAALASGDWVTLQVKKGSPITAVSNIFEFVV